MSDQTHGARQSGTAGASPIDDDTIVRPMGGFYGRPAAGSGGSSVGASGPTSAPTPPRPTVSNSASNSAGQGGPTLAERIMRRLPAPPEKAQARQNLEQRQRQAEAQRVRDLEELRRADMAATRQHDPVPAAAAQAAAPSAAQPTGQVAAPSAVPASPQVVARAARRTRKARLRIARLDPWSVMKTFFLFSIASGIAFVTFVALLYMLIDGSGLFDQVDEMVQIIFGQPNDTTRFEIRQVAGWERVLGISALLACINVVILTALATLGSFLYNLSATMLGGLEVTLAED